MLKRESLRRRRPFRNPQPRILIVCEGTETEPGYFWNLRHKERSLIDLDIKPGGVPKTLVERAVYLKRVAEKQSKSQRDANLQYDHVWCVFDVDEHPNVNDAKQQARDNGVDLAISNPCFEIWLLLHFQDQRSHIDRFALHSECVKYLPMYEKKVPFEKVHANYEDAVQRTQALDAWQKSRGCQELNPWTGVQRLTELIRTFGRSRAFAISTQD